MQIKCFGIARDITKTDSIPLAISTPKTVAELRQFLNSEYPELGKIKSYMIAVNQEYASDTTLLRGNEEVAIIPPVSGG